MSVFLLDADREWRPGQRQILDVARELAAKGIKAHLVVEPESELARRAAAANLSVLPLRMRGRMAWLVRRGLTGLMRDHGCRVLHAHEPFGAVLGLAAAAAAEVPIRVLSRGADPSPLEGRLPLTAVDAIVAGSEGVKSILVRGGVPEPKVEVVPLGVDFSAFTTQARDGFVRRELGLGADDFLVGAILPLEDERGHAALIEAAALARAQAPKVKIIVLGEGSVRLDGGEGQDIPGLDGVRYFLGFRGEAPRVLASLDMFAVFSHLDGLGQSLIEAMASGLPVAAADVGTARDLIIHRENGLLVPARNAKALADAIIKVHVDRVLAARLSGRGRETVLERYSVEAMARRVTGIYEYRAHRKGIKLV